MPARVLLLLPTTTYKAEAFLDAAEALGVDVVVGTDGSQALQSASPDRTLVLDFARPERGLRRIGALHARKPLDAVVGTDDESVEFAARAAADLGLRHNPPQAVRASRDKHETRRRLSVAGLHQPAFRTSAIDEPPHAVAAAVRYPCVLKPLFLAAGRGVLRADDPAEFVRAFERIAALLARPDVRRRSPDAGRMIVEDYLPGAEVSLEGLLERGRLRVLALFDKPDPLEGPTFEESLFVTPSRLAAEVQSAVADEASAACSALGLVDGPIHAELRVADGRPWVLEVAARTIGGLCGRALRFGAGLSLEQVVLHHVLGRDLSAIEREAAASGVMMIPIPQAGVLRGVRGIELARAVPHIEDLTISVRDGAEVVPLPEGHRYLGFLFARADTPDRVEQALRRAHAQLTLDID